MMTKKRGHRESKWIASFVGLGPVSTEITIRHLEPQESYRETWLIDWVSCTSQILSNFLNIFWLPDKDVITHWRMLYAVYIFLFIVPDNPTQREWHQNLYDIEGKEKKTLTTFCGSSIKYGVRKKWDIKILDPSWYTFNSLPEQGSNLNCRRVNSAPHLPRQTISSSRIILRCPDRSATSARPGAAMA